MSHYLVTGATGVVGAALVEHVVSEGHSVTVLVRDRRRAEGMLGDLRAVSVVEASLADAPSIAEHVTDLDYVVHAAAPTRSAFFVERPVDTIQAITAGTAGLLELARIARVTGVLYISTMEVYGVPPSDHELVESDQFYVDPLQPRSSYPAAKRLAEALCSAYVHQYGTPVRIARLAQVIGRQVTPGDDRILAEMARAAAAGQPIRLMTDGKAEQTLISIDDAVRGLLTVLHHGADGEAYNVADEKAFVSMRDLAEIVAEVSPGPKCDVETGVGGDSGRFPPSRSIRLSTQKLRELGWEPQDDLRDALRTLTMSVLERGE